MGAGGANPERDAKDTQTNHTSDHSRLRQVSGKLSSLRNSWSSAVPPLAIQNDSGTVDGAGLEEDGPLPEGHGDTVEKPSTLDRLQGLRQKTKVKAKHLLNMDDNKDDDGELREGDAALESLGSDPAFNPHKLIAKGRLGTGSSADKTLGTLQTVAASVAHPKKAIKSKATRTAGQVSKAEHPYLSRQADSELLEAHAQLHRAESSTDGPADTKNAMCEDSKETLTMLETRRESLKVAWTTHRHVHRVRVVPKRHLRFPARSEFVECDAAGKVVRYQWERWLGYMLLYYSQDFSTQYVDDFDDLPFDVDTLRLHIERLVMASEPWQAWAMNVRQVYRWEDPQRTGKWLALFVVLWYTSHIVAFFYAYIIYMIIYNRYFPASVERLQQSMDRAKDRSSTAMKVGELIDKHGRDDWIEPLVDHLGPYIQLQLGDVANILEVLSNFYAWKSPKKTVGALFFIFSCLMVCLSTDMEYCMKIVWFVVGGAFFFCWPIASRYPKYRYLVSPIKWVLWDIPTDAEWSFQYLRRQAQLKRERMIAQRVEDVVQHEEEKPVTTSCEGALDESQPTLNGDMSDGDEDWYSIESADGILDDADVMSLKCDWRGTVGRLVIFTGGIRFVQSLGKKELWRRSYQELAEMRKVSPGRLRRYATSASNLEIKFTDGEIVLLGMKKDRDEAVNTIIGFSSLQWQTLQTMPGKRHDGTQTVAHWL